MFRETSNLLLYSNLGEDSVLLRMADIFRDWENGACDKPALQRRIFVEVKKLLDLATMYGFDRNLWHCYLTYILITNENSFSVTCERVGAGNGSVNLFAKSDFRIFKRLFDFNFKKIEADLGLECFTILTDYHAISKREQLYYKNFSEKTVHLADAIASAKDENEVFDLVTEHYRIYGIGMFGLNRAFRIIGSDSNLQLQAINNVDSVLLSDLTGYEIQKKLLRENIEAFCNGKPYNNMLLYGDAGTGKSTSVKAILNEYYDSGLRMIEIYKHQFNTLSDVIARIKNRNYRFIIFIDDLSFEEHEIEYKYLKAVIEGGLETRPDNVMICATSNRRHLIRENWKDRSDMEFKDDIHRSDTMEEKLSLAARFGCAINYNAPDRKLFHEIVRNIAARYPECKIDEERLIFEANQWEIRHGGISGRTAQQFVNHLIGISDSK